MWERATRKSEGLAAIMWEDRWWELQFIFHLRERGHVPWRQDAIALIVSLEVCAKFISQRVQLYITTNTRKYMCTNLELSNQSLHKSCSIFGAPSVNLMKKRGKWYTLLWLLNVIWIKQGFYLIRGTNNIFVKRQYLLLNQLTPINHGFWKAVSFHWLHPGLISANFVESRNQSLKDLKIKCIGPVQIKNK